MTTPYPTLHAHQTAQPVSAHTLRCMHIGLHTVYPTLHAHQSAYPLRVLMHAWCKGGTKLKLAPICHAHINPFTVESSLELHQPQFSCTFVVCLMLLYSDQDMTAAMLRAGCRGISSESVASQCLVQAQGWSLARPLVCPSFKCRLHPNVASSNTAPGQYSGRVAVDVSRSKLMLVTSSGPTTSRQTVKQLLQRFLMLCNSSCTISCHT